MSPLGRLHGLLATSLLAFTLATRATAQCNVGDGLDGGTTGCTGAFTYQPQAAFTQPALGICWKDCGVDTTLPYRAKWAGLAPIFNVLGAAPSCAWYSTNLQLYLGSALAWSGKMHATYSRTWLEMTPPPALGNYQVWRYLVNGDLIPQGTTAGPCALPPCAAPNGNFVRFTGYIDYALDCNSAGGLVVQSWMITHACDAIDHAPGFPRAGAFHPDRFYTFLGPRAGFVVGLGASLEVGTTSLEAMRRWDALAMPARCNHEEPLITATMNPLANLCLCGVGPALWYEASLTVQGIFGSIAMPFPGSDPFRSFPIGAWTNPNVFPGNEELRWNSNELMYIDCTGVAPRSYYFGVTTAGGFPAFQISSLSPPPPPVSLPPIFVDQSDSVILPAGISTRNRPYRSNHILNLNF